MNTTLALFCCILFLSQTVLGFAPVFHQTTSSLCVHDQDDEYLSSKLDYVRSTTSRPKVSCNTRAQTPIMDGCLKNYDTTVACFAAQNASAFTYSLILGAAAPDYLKSLSVKLHSFEYAAIQYQLAEQQTRGRFMSAVNQDKFDPLGFALGYGMHLAEDLVGHYKTGVLTPKYDHPIEFAIDTWAYATYMKHIQKFKTAYPLPVFNDIGLEFVYQAQQQFALWTRDNTPHNVFHAFNKTQVNDGVNDFEKKMLLEAAAVTLNFLWKEELVEMDFCHAQSFEEAESHVLLSQQMCMDACNEWLSIASSSQISSPSSIKKLMQTKVTKIYDAIGGSICVEA